jgi:3-oxoacyl-[acyl-carrier protein] reductase
MGKLDGKVALVTGSGRNIGRMTVLKLAEEGAHVVVNSRTNQAEADAVAREAQARGVKAISIVADVGKKDQVEAMASRALSEFGRVDILINNAAIRPHKPFTELTPQDWEHVRSVVLDGALYLTRAVIGSMVKNRYGRIVFFTGEGAFMGGAGRAHVSAAKMGLVGLARGLAS